MKMNKQRYIALAIIVFIVGAFYVRQRRARERDMAVINRMLAAANKPIPPSPPHIPPFPSYAEEFKKK